tara:strand:- start:70 stop:747 length:678 start_codon:yes stop_codon:yes gene_type:complete
MITVPVTILDNFLENPLALRKWALDLEYHSDTHGTFPGERTLPLKQLQPDFNQYVTSKIVNLFFDDFHQIEVDGYFQNITNLPESGWVHQDHSLFTAIIYLSPSDPNINRGTSLYELNSTHFYSTQNYPTDKKIWELRRKQYLKGNLTLQEIELKNYYENQTFTQTLNIPDKFNRLIVFDAQQFHANNPCIPSITKDRLTLILFFKKIASKSLPSLVRSKKTIEF